jgi:hypothetical protein
MLTHATKCYAQEFRATRWIHMNAGCGMSVRQRNNG